MFRLAAYIFIAFLLIGGFDKSVRCQNADEPNYVFAIFETAVSHGATSDANPEERRIYVSNLVAIPPRDPAELRRASKTADEYFINAIVAPMKAHGILHAYYDDGISINNNVVYVLYTRAEVEELREHTLADLKERGANIFTFTWEYGKVPNGIETAKPTLYFRAEKQPLYGAAEINSAMPVKTGPQPKARQKPH